MQVEMLSVD